MPLPRSKLAIREFDISEFESHMPSHAVGLYERAVFPASLGTIARIRHLTSCSHHDALEFPGGQIVLLTRLRPGQVAAVLQLPAVPAKHGHLEEERGAL